MLARLAVAIAGLIGASIQLVPSAQASGQLPPDGTWVLSRSGSTKLQDTQANLPFFTIVGGAISGFDGCNRFAGRLDLPHRIVTGQRACLRAHLKLPLDLSNPVAHLKAGRMSGGRLLLPARSGFEDSEFHRR